MRGILLRLAECPAPLHPMMREFVAIGRKTARMGEGDTMEALMRAGVRASLVRASGVGSGSGGRRSAEGHTVAFANLVIMLTLAITRLLGFRERQNDVFRVLCWSGSHAVRVLF
jgi:hypothetical protein